MSYTCVPVTNVLEEIMQLTGEAAQPECQAKTAPLALPEKRLEDGSETILTEKGIDTCRCVSFVFKRCQNKMCKTWKTSLDFKKLQSAPVVNKGSRDWPCVSAILVLSHIDKTMVSSTGF